MVEIIVTKDVKHLINNDYTCVLIQFTEEDKHFHKEKLNWLPKHHEIRDYLIEIMRVEPKDKKQLLAEYFMNGIIDGYKKSIEEELK